MSDEMHATELTCDDVREMAGSFVLGALDPADGGRRPRPPRRLR